MVEIEYLCAIEKEEEKLERLKKFADEIGELLWKEGYYPKDGAEPAGTDTLQIRVGENAIIAIVTKMDGKKRDGIEEQIDKIFAKICRIKKLGEEENLPPPD